MMPQMFTPKRFRVEDIEPYLFDDSYAGFCIKCGAQRDGCEPDARNYPCWDCGEREVFGAEELFIMDLVV